MHKSKFDVILPLQLSDSKFSKLVCLNLRERESTTDAPSSAAVTFNLWSALPLRNLAAYVALWWLTKHIFAEIAARCLDYPICCYLSLPSPSPPIGVCARGWHDFSPSPYSSGGGGCPKGIVPRLLISCRRRSRHFARKIRLGMLVVVVVARESGANPKAHSVGAMKDNLLRNVKSD